MCSSGATCLWWPSVLLLEETGELEENHRPVASSCKFNYHAMSTTAGPRNRQSLYINHRVFKTITVRVYAIIHFCDSMWSLWVEAILVVYIYFAFGDPIIKMGVGVGSWGWDPIKRFNPVTYVVVFYVFNDLRWEVTVRFVDIGGIVDHHYWNFLCILLDILLPFSIYIHTVCYTYPWKKCPVDQMCSPSAGEAYYEPSRCLCDYGTQKSRIWNPLTGNEEF
jgi:hypothetical protein